MSTPPAPGDAARRFDTVAAGYVTSVQHARGRSLQRLVEVLGPQPEHVALDVATGAGHAALALAAHVRRVVAYDPAPNMLRAAAALATERGVGSLAYVRGLAEDLPFARASFDHGVARIAPHHFHDVRRFVRELARVTRPGGRVAVVDLVGRDDPELDAFNHELEVLHDPTHVRSYRESDWRGFFADAGLRLEHVEQLTDRPEGIVLADWCQTAATPPENRVRLRELLERAPARLREAFGVRPDAGDLRIHAHLLVLIAGAVR